MSQNQPDNYMGDVEFEGYLRGVDPAKKMSVAAKLDGLDLNTPEGVQAAKDLLLTEIDFRFQNARGIAGREIRAISALLAKKSVGGEIVARGAGKELYRRRIGPKEYIVVSPPAELLMKYKGQVDTIVATLKTGSKENIARLLSAGAFDGSRSANAGPGMGVGKVRGDIDSIMGLLESGEINNSRYPMLAIAILTGINRSKGLTLGNSALKLIKAGAYPAEKAFEKDGAASCIDVGVLNKQLAKMYGIESDMYTIGNERTGHRFLVTSTGEVIDGWTPALFYPSFEAFKSSVQSAEIKKENYDLEL